MHIEDMNRNGFLMHRSVGLGRLMLVRETRGMDLLFVHISSRGNLVTGNRRGTGCEQQTEEQPQFVSSSSHLPLSREH
jgi:hypothetical protein